MPMIGWLFLVLSMALIVGSLLFLRDAGRIPMSREKLERVRKRKQEMEDQDKKDGKD
ncbi:MAG TPA: DUF2897 domain-containing protein [Marinobacter sp.]|uniref:DUF2897 family protein n=1 Tax=Marinobacter sp. TaxID=50741 RepID=UPI000EC96071|nr:DUF2897 family protein [Marinobacter sp.]MBC7193167.1 DUF2897 family protein [Marinobacter sp.]HCW90043.1 DUF2897 domain-containing protein [Marinobacter sp.]